MWTNYHCHTNYCDGKKPVAEVAAEARQKGMLALGISSHAPLPFDKSWCMKKEDLDSYLLDIESEKGKPGTQIYAGLEIDFIPGKISPGIFRNRLDYTVGSVHFVDSFPDVEENSPYNGWEIDGTYQLFIDGVDKIFNGDVQRAIMRYYELTREMIATSPPDVVGHMDKIKMHNRDNQFFSEEDVWYRKEIAQTLDAIAAKGCVIEVNTRGIYQKKTTTTYPSPWILKEILARNIPITISSDAHHPDDLVNHFQETARELLAMGFKKIRILLDGRWTDVAFNENGVEPITT
jgi:histidinol-phosphatase (PHP family)